MMLAFSQTRLIKLLQFYYALIYQIIQKLTHFDFTFLTK